jgi:triosephosphate isomerase
VGADTCIVGHSERRQLYGETDEQIRDKLLALRSAGLLAILCVGETLEQREANQHETVVERQLRGALMGADAAMLSGLAVAYEPVWAIGTGRTATPEQANAMHAVIRKALGAIVAPEAAADVPILYGGSVNADNAASLLGQPEINGALVGGASLKADSFLAIINQAKA